MLLQMICTVHLLHAGDGWCMCLHSCVQGLCTQECNGGNGVLLQIMILAAAAVVWAINTRYQSALSLLITYFWVADLPMHVAAVLFG